VFQNVKTGFARKRIGYLEIGAGSAGGDWEVILAIIMEELIEKDHTFVRYQP
jgi:hypothetical protein